MSDKSSEEKNIKARILEIIVEIPGVKAEQVTPEALLVDLGVNAPDQLKLVKEIAEKLKKTLVFDEEAETKAGNLQTVGDVITFIIEALVKNIIVKQLGAKAEDVKHESNFVKDLGADSLDTVELVMAFEEECGINVPDEEAELLQSVGEVIAYITSKPIGNAGGARS